MASRLKAIAPRVAASALVAVSAIAHGALITVEAAVGWSCTTGNGGFEPGCTPDVELGRLRFSYEAVFADSNPAPDTGTFSGLITDFRMTVAQDARPDLEFQLVGGGSMSFTRFGAGGADQRLTINVVVDDLSGSLGIGSLSLNVYNTNYLSTLDAPPAVAFWLGAFANVGTGYGASERDWGTNFRATIPEPGSAMLGALALLLACACRQQPRHG